jgi:hypothetical protein
MKFEIQFEGGRNNKPSSSVDERRQDYKGEYVVLRINEAEKGHEFLRPIIPYVAPAED